MKRIAFLITVIAALTIAVSPASAAKKGFKTGTNAASGDIPFNFKVHRDSCYQSGIKKRSGYCLSGISSTAPRLQMICPQVQGGVRDFLGLAFLPDHNWIPKNGRACDNLLLRAQRKSISVISTCESGVKNFTAKR